MSTRSLLNRISMKALGRVCSVAIIIPSFTLAEFWVWQNARKVFDGRAEATYWFAPDGTATTAFHVEQKNWRDVPVRTVHQYDGFELGSDQMQWYDEHGNELDWQAVKAGDHLWRYEAELRTPVDRREWIRYTVWVRDLQPETMAHEGQQWGIYKEENGDWVFHNDTALGPENTVSMVFPPDTEILLAEPANRANVNSGGYCPTVRFDDLREAHTVRWRLHQEPPDEASSDAGA